MIEILVSLGIIIAMLVTLSALIKISVLQKTARSEEVARTIATDALEDLRIGGYASLPASGALSNPNLSLLQNGSGTITVTVYDSKTKKVEVTVSWTAKSGASHTLTLSTLITETGGLL
jgi:type II secretory pathway pseudopilin PulG